MKKLIPLFALALFAVSCQQKLADNATYEMDGFSNEAAPVTKQEIITQPSASIDLNDKQVVSQKIIRNGQIGIKVADLVSTKQKIDSLVKKYQGYYNNESLNNSDWETSYSLNIRIPCDFFEPFINAVEQGEGEVTYKRIDAQDVTDQFIDLETRLANKRSYIIRYNELLKLAKNVKDILEIEQQIRILEEEIESTTGRLKYLANQVEFSTLDLTLTKPKDFVYSPANRDKFIERLKQALSKGWYGFIDFLLFIFKLWPVWVLLPIVFYMVRKIKQRLRPKS